MKCCLCKCAHLCACICIHTCGYVCKDEDIKMSTVVISLGDKITNACFFLIYIFQIFYSEHVLFL